MQPINGILLLIQEWGNDIHFIVKQIKLLLLLYEQTSFY